MRKLLCLLLFAIISYHFATNPKWFNYTSGDEIMALAEEGDYLWVGTFGGPVNLNKIKGEGVFFSSIKLFLPYCISPCIHLV